MVKIPFDSSVESIRNEIVNLNISVKAIIQDILQCTGPIEDLNDLNGSGRKNIAALRNNLQLLKSVAEEELKESIRNKLLEEIKDHEKELATTVSAFQKANINSLIEIDKANRNELLGNNDEESVVRNRKKKDRENLVKMSSHITDQLLNISRTLAETTERSSDTLDTLVTSSSAIDGTRLELDNTGSVISQSGKLLSKYGRREKTDKFLVLSAFLFFIGCVFYIIQKRLF